METLLYTVVKVEHTSAGVSLSVRRNSEDADRIDMLISEESWAPLTLAEGSEFDDTVFSELNRAAVINRAISRMVKILSYSDHSCSQLIKKLETHGFDREIGEIAAEYAVEHGYVNEEEQAIRAASYYARSKYWGKKRIAWELLSRGYKRDVALKATRSISDDDYIATLKKVMSRKYSPIPTEAHERNSMIAALGRLGYSMSEIEKVSEELENEE